MTRIHQLNEHRSSIPRGLATTDASRLVHRMSTSLPFAEAHANSGDRQRGRDMDHRADPHGGKGKQARVFVSPHV